MVRWCRKAVVKVVISAGVRGREAVAGCQLPGARRQLHLAREAVLAILREQVCSRLMEWLAGTECGAGYLSRW